MWKTVKLDEIVNVSMGKTPSRGNEKFWDKEKKTKNIWLSIADLSALGGLYVEDSKEYVSDEGAKLFKTVPSETLVMSFKLSIGKLAITKCELRTNEAIAALPIRDEKLITKEYLYYFLSSIDWNTLPGNDVKVKGKTLNKAKLKEILILYPPLAEQKRIVAKLNAAFAEIDTAVVLATERCSRLKLALGSLVDLTLNELRSNFSSCLLGDMIEKVEYGTSTKCSQTGTYPVLRMGNMQSGKFILDDLVYLDDTNEFKKYQVTSGDVFFNRTNSPLHVGKTAIYEGDEKFLFAGYLIRLKFSEEIIDSKFLMYYLNAPSTRKHGYSVMTSSVNQANINGSKLKEYPFIRLDIDTQRFVRQKFEKIEIKLEEAIENVEQSLKEYSALKSSILAQELQPPLSDAA